ncbi:MAG: hypothetical protein ACW98Y_10260 [Candidatus Thorarchaeota archaeon]
MMKTHNLSYSVPVEPDHFVRKVTRTQAIVILVISIIACWFVPEFLPSVAQAVPDLVWIAFHVAYLGLLGVIFYRSFKPTKMADVEVV